MGDDADADGALDDGFISLGDETAAAVADEADAVDPDFDPDDDVTPASTSAYAPALTSTSQVTMRDPEPTSRKRKAPPAPRPKRRRKTKAAPVLSEYELGRREKIKRNNKFLVSVGLLVPPRAALEDDEHPWWYMTAR